MKSRTNKQPSDIVEMVRRILPEDPQFADELQDQISRRQIVRQLARLRNRNGISQADVAAELKCTQSRISKLENSFDEDVTIGELAAYAKVAGCELSLNFEPKDAALTSRIAYHSDAIKACFDQVAGAEEGDFAIGKGVAAFHLEALFNLAKLADGTSCRPQSATARNAGPSVCLQLPSATFSEGSAGTVHTDAPALS